MAEQLFEFYDGKSHKFWGATVEGAELTLRYGKWWSRGTSKSKTYDSPEAAQAHFEKTRAKKLKEGYVEADPEMPLNARAELDDAIARQPEDFSFNCPSLKAFREACGITSLTELRISGSLREVPAEIAQLTQLKRLSLESNEIRHLPPEIGALQNLETLYCYSNKLQDLPPEFGQLKKLRKAVLWSNELKTLPEEIGGLQALDELELKWNQIERLPESIGTLPKLVELDLGDNELSALPESLATSNIKVLNLKDNAFDTFPEVLTRMAHLEVLNLGENNIPALPESVAGMAALRVLAIKAGYGGGPLASLPEGLFGLPKLEKLDLQRQALTSVPAGLAKLPSLADLSLYGNPLTDVPEEVVQQGKEAVFLHLGLVEEATVDAVDPEERARVVAARAEGFEAFRRAAKEAYCDDTLLKQILEFLKGETEGIPGLKRRGHDDFKGMVELLQPFGAQDFVDARVLTLLTGECFHFKRSNHHTGFYEAYHRWLKGQIQGEKGADVFGQSAAALEGHGVDRLKAIDLGLEEMGDLMLTKGGTPTSFGQALLDDFEAHDEHIVATAVERWRSREGLTELLAKHRLEAVGPHLEALLKYTGKGEEKHAPYDELGFLIEADAETYKPHLEAALAQTLSPISRGKLARLLVTHYPERERAWSLAEEVLQTISQKRNTEDRYRFSWGGGYADDTHGYIDWLFEAFGTDEPVAKAVFAYVDGTKILSLDVTAVVAKHLGQRGVETVAEALNMKIESADLAPHYERVFALLKPLDWSAFHAKGWTLAANEYIEIADLAGRGLAQAAPEGLVEAAVARLGEKDKRERQAGTLVLGHSGNAGALAAYVDAEKDEGVRDLMLAFIHAEPRSIDRAEAERRVAVAKARKKLKPPKKWLDVAALPALEWAEGGPVDPDLVLWLCYRQNRLNAIGAEVEARDVYPLLQRSDAFARDLYRAIENNGGVYAKNRFALSVAGLLDAGGLVDDLVSLTLKKQNENAARVLGLGASLAAMRGLDTLVRAFRTKYPNVGAAATESLEGVAARQGIDLDALRDLIVPDLGFGGPTWALTIGGDAWTAELDAKSLKLVFTDPAGKVRKSVPKAADAATKAAVKAASKGAREALTEQRKRLEEELVVQHRREAGAWRALFTQNPVLRALGQSLVWGAYTPELSATFRLGGAGAESVDGPPFDPTGQVGLVHPLELDEPTLDAWSARIAALKLGQSINQLLRDVHRPDPKDAAKAFLYEFDGEQTGGNTFKGRADKLGWRRGSVNDGGGISGYLKRFPQAGVDAFVMLDGLGVGGDYGPCTLKRVFFVEGASVATGSYTYDEPRDESDERLIALGAVDAVVYSEALRNLAELVR